MSTPNAPTALPPTALPPTAPTPTPTVWTPSAGTRCGVAQYAAELVAALRGIGCPARHEAEPDLAGVVPGDAARNGVCEGRVLHLQHEHSLVAPERVAAVARDAHERGVPLVVTEHTVRPAADGRDADDCDIDRRDVDGWEADVAALVAHSAEGATLLRERRPGRRVEVVPHGCPTWFPPRRRHRGRVVATFGFLEPHKGLARLLDAAAALGDVELLLVGSTRAAWADEWVAGLRWSDRAAADRPVPVRRVTEFLPEEEIARLLAVEADVLVFPYAAPRFAAVSGAVRVGLASGVPVLTTPTTWFSDLRRVTLQDDDLAAGIARLLDDTALRDTLTGAAREHCETHSWPRTARRHAELYGSL